MHCSSHSRRARRALASAAVGQRALADRPARQPSSSSSRYGGKVDNTHRQALVQHGRGCCRQGSARLFVIIDGGVGMSTEAAGGGLLQRNARVANQVRAALLECPHDCVTPLLEWNCVEGEVLDVPPVVRNHAEEASDVSFVSRGGQCAHCRQLGRIRSDAIDDKFLVVFISKSNANAFRSKQLQNFE